MQAKDLNADERAVLFALLAHLSMADRSVSSGELGELDALGEEMGIESLPGAIAAARASFPTPAAALTAANTISRTDARELIRTLLHDLATSDGDRGDAETQLLADLATLWPRT